MEDNKKLIDKLYKTNSLSSEELYKLIKSINSEERDLLYFKSQQTKEKYYGKKVFIRGLLEITNYCSQYCYYCGINRENINAERYRLNKKEILDSIKYGYRLGIRTFVLQGGEDLYYTDDIIIDIIESIKKEYSDIAITLSLGEKPKYSYESYYNAGADRYLLRHETSNEVLYRKIHEKREFKSRKDSLYELKKIRYQTGAGFMVGIPGQTNKDLVKDLLFIKKLDPEMAGIGPFIPHKDTIYKYEKAGSIEKTIDMLAIVRLLVPHILLPATTAISTINKKGRDKALEVASNVIMPNISPISYREKYNLYNNKSYSGTEGAEMLQTIELDLRSIGLELDMSIGDNINWGKEND